MAENTKIQWATHTFNPWRGCTKIAAGCANCYADTQSKRNPGTLGVWGPNGTRVVASEAMWREPLKWQRAERERRECCLECEDITPRCEHCGPRPRVFCASLADVFEDWGQEMRTTSGMVMHQCDEGHLLGLESVFANGCDCIHGCTRLARPTTLDDVRSRLFRLWRSTLNLDYLALTKRPENARRMLDGRHENLWLGTSIACQEDADRSVPELLKCRDLCAKTFLSLEPLIGPVDLTRVDLRSDLPVAANYEARDVLRGDLATLDATHGERRFANGAKVDWVIVGGESGPHARPCNVEWIRSIVRQCQAANVPVFVKQWGSNPHYTNHQGDSHSCGPIRDPKGGEPAEWPEDVRVREVP